MNKFYVYLHRRATDNKVFYVGKGCGRRAWTQHNRSTYWKNVANKHGLVVEIVFDNLSEEDAFQCEIDAILEFKYMGEPLVNLTKGGPGSSVRGRKASDESKTKMSLARKNKPKSILHKMNISKALSSTTLRHDKTKYYFENISLNLIEYCTRRELSTKYNIKLNSLNKLFSKKPACSCLGWRIKNDR